MRGAIPIEGEELGYRGERFDYTKWQRKQFDRMNSDEFHDAAIEYFRENPFRRE